MTLHASDAAVTAQAKQMAKKKSRKYVALTAGVGVLLAGGAAYAAVALFGFGSIDSGEATLKDLTVSQSKLTGALVPGKSVGGQADVANGNDFDVIVSGIVLKDSSLQATGAKCDPATVTPGGTVTTYPGAGGGAGHLITLAAPITIPANQAKTITAQNVVAQAASANGLCGVKADFAVVAAVGS